MGFFPCMNLANFFRVCPKEQIIHLRFQMHSASDQFIKKGGVRIHSAKKRMETKNIITLVLIVYLSLAVLTGIHRGILSKGRWVLGVVFGILAVPIISPVIEGLLVKTKIAQMIITDIPGLSSVTAYVLRLLVFSISLVLVKKIVYILTDFDLPKGVTAVDKIAGGVFSVIEASLVIWIFEILITANTGIIAFTNLHNQLVQSGLYAFIADHNLLAKIFH